MICRHGPGDGRLGRRPGVCQDAGAAGGAVQPLWQHVQQPGAFHSADVTRTVVAVIHIAALTQTAGRMQHACVPGRHLQPAPAAVVCGRRRQLKTCTVTIAPPQTRCDPPQTLASLEGGSFVSRGGSVAPPPLPALRPDESDNFVVTSPEARPTVIEGCVGATESGRWLRHATPPADPFAATYAACVDMIKCV